MTADLRSTLLGAGSVLAMPRWSVSQITSGRKRGRSLLARFLRLFAMYCAHAHRSRKVSKDCRRRGPAIFDTFGIFERDQRAIARTPIPQFHRPLAPKPSLIATAFIRHEASVIWLKLICGGLCGCGPCTQNRGAPSQSPSLWLYLLSRSSEYGDNRDKRNKRYKTTSKKHLARKWRPTFSLALGRQKVDRHKSVQIIGLCLESPTPSTEK